MICITSTGTTMDAMVDHRFGRCSYFLFIDEEKESIIEVIPNPNLEVLHGAGVQSAQIVAERKPELLITGNIGPNAYSLLTSAGVKVAAGFFGKVSDAVKEYKSGKLKLIDAPNVPGHFGKGSGNRR